MSAMSIKSPSLRSVPRTAPDENQDECTRDVKTTPSPSGTVKFIRLTDDGEFADRCELTEAVYEVRNPKLPVLAVWYVHGWKHSADPADSDVKEFRNLIGQLSEQQRQFDEGERRHVVGIYVGWDGAIGPPWLHNLTFWNRKHAADRISQSSVLTKIIAAAKYARLQMDEKLTRRDMTVLIGHSFGGRILYTATSHVLINEVQRLHPGYRASSYGLIKGPADLILLLNPAFEASIFTAMSTTRRPDSKTWEAIDLQQQPVLLSITTENDWATGTAFPLGRILESARRDRQRQALGHYKQYVTHSLLAAAKNDEDRPPKGRFWYDDFEIGGLQLRRTTDRQPGNPFILATTTPDVIDGHNGIWGENLRRWIIGFLLKIEEHRASYYYH